LTASHALYARGTFGIIPGFFVHPAFRSQYVGRRLMEQAVAFGHSRGWTRLEVTTPPLPQFDQTLAFYAGWVCHHGRVQAEAGTVSRLARAAGGWFALWQYKLNLFSRSPSELHL
jgi:GNAT superfamily N-acetyltransferase